MPRKSEAATAVGGAAPRAWGALGRDRAFALIVGVAMLALIAVPFVGNGYVLSLLTFVAINAVAGFGLQILLGFAGQVCLGQAAFLASGAYASAYVERLGLGSLAAFAAAILVSVALGLLIAVPALRLAGLYLAIATMSFGFIVEEVTSRWTSVTGGNAGEMVPPITIAGFKIDQPWEIYALSWIACLIALWLARNLALGPTGRALMALQDSEIAAQSSGVRLAGAKGVAFGLNAAFAGVAGALYGHELGFISPDQFTISVSLEFLVMILIGGLGSLSGVLYGAIFVVLAPEGLQRIVSLFTGNDSELPGVRPLLFGASLIAVLLFQPMGIAAIVARFERSIASRFASGRGG